VFCILYGTHVCLYSSVYFCILDPDQVQNTRSVMQGQEATAAVFIEARPPQKSRKTTK